MAAQLQLQYAAPPSLLPNSAQQGYQAVVAADGVSWTYLRKSGTAAQRPVQPPTGFQFLDTTDNGLDVWDGASWQRIGYLP